MKRNPEHGSNANESNRPTVNTLRELDGFLSLGLKSEALCLARRTLKETSITADSFNAVLNAIFTLDTRPKRWLPLVESAYARLPKRSQRSVCLAMMSLHSCNQDYEAVSRFIPRRFGGDVGLSELAFAMEAGLAVGKMDQVEKLARRLPHALKVAEHPLMQAQLRHCLAEYHARRGNWDKAAKFWEIVTFNETLSDNAVIGIVELHVASALRTIRHGFRLIQEFNKNFDPEAEIILPGNDRAIQQNAAKQYKRLQKLLEQIVPKERQMELGIYAKT